MSATAIPARITIDFRESLEPAHGWIVGLSEAPRRVELLAVGAPSPDEAQMPIGAADPGCTCPEFCERDHDVD